MVNISGRLALFRALVSASVLLALLFLPALALRQDAAEAFAAARYAEARSLLAEEGESTALEDVDLLLGLRLSSDPQTALELAKLGQNRHRQDPDLRTCFALEEASIHFARGRFLDALKPLTSLIEDADDPLPGAVYLLAGQAWRNLQESQNAREALATVRRDDPAFPWSRYYLGRLAIEAGDEALALRYFETAERTADAERHPSLLAGKWHALRMAGQHEEASRTRQTLLEKHPGSLAALHMQEVLERDVEAVDLGATTPLVESTDGADGESGRLALQLAAFADRGRALAYLATWLDRLPDLRLVEEDGPEGVPLYKIRTGHFASRAQADIEAERLRRSLGLELLVVESGR